MNSMEAGYTIMLFNTAPALMVSVICGLVPVSTMVTGAVENVRLLYAAFTTPGNTTAKLSKSNATILNLFFCILFWVKDNCLSLTGVLGNRPRFLFKNAPVPYSLAPQETLRSKRGVSHPTTLVSLWRYISLRARKNLGACRICHSYSQDYII